ncbi:hypothetical protein [Candidatus Venteria ishoeyi]|uniref:Uncharacterized protein n=1 Tax=Candidatus Venteria ishoeyi TaxID=1899563 RepID=A0A1H6F5A8_9GAMM|nr:hypothetical protein [Candidatus Venteria ishoeyi]SEH05348.1 Uncharacterised protein [Candidatus Venteria ishoeyi]
MGQEIIKEAYHHGISAKHAHDWAERAAIMEYDGGLPRLEAEKRAATILKDRYPDTAPAKARVIHYSEQGQPRCGQTRLGGGGKTKSPQSGDWEKVTCKKCLRYIGQSIL